MTDNSKYTWSWGAGWPNYTIAYRFTVKARIEGKPPCPSIFIVVTNPMDTYGQNVEKAHAQHITSYANNHNVPYVYLYIDGTDDTLSGIVNHTMSYCIDRCDVKELKINRKKARKYILFLEKNVNKALDMVDGLKDEVDPYLLARFKDIANKVAIIELKRKEKQNGKN